MYYLYILFFDFRIGTMHVVATNVILWFRTLIKESIEEIWEYEVEETHHFRVYFIQNITYLITTI